MTRIKFTKQFVNGTLKGLTYDDTLLIRDNALVLGQFHSMINDARSGKVIRSFGRSSDYKIVWGSIEIAA